MTYTDPTEALNQIGANRSGHPLATGAVAAGAVIAYGAYQNHKDQQEQLALKGQIEQQVIDELKAAAYSPEGAYQVNQRFKAASATLRTAQLARRHSQHVTMAWVIAVIVVGFVLMCLPW